MLRNVTLAFVAAASLSAMALAPSTASAGGVFWPKYPHHHHWGHGHGFSIGFGGGWLLRDPPRADAVRLSLAHREHLLLIPTHRSFGSEASAAPAAGVFCVAVAEPRTAATRRVK